MYKLPEKRFYFPSSVLFSVDILFIYTYMLHYQIMNLKLEDVGAQRSFIFLWCGSCEGLDLGREVSAAVVHVLVLV